MKFINRNNRKLKKHLKKLSGSIRHVLAVPFLVPDVYKRQAFILGYFLERCLSRR